MASVDLGNYSESRRMEEVKRRLDKSIADFRKSRHTNNSGKETGLQQTFLEEENGKIETTAQKIDKFQGPHFTQEYRILREECVQHQLKLDGFDHCGSDKNRENRKGALCRIEEMLNRLNSKTHASGEPCPDCELQKI